MSERNLFDYADAAWHLLRLAREDASPFMTAAEETAHDLMSEAEEALGKMQRRLLDDPSVYLHPVGTLLDLALADCNDKATRMRIEQARALLRNEVRVDSRVDSLVEAMAALKERTLRLEQAVQAAAPPSEDIPF